MRKTSNMFIPKTSLMRLLMLKCNVLETNSAFCVFILL